jgi:protein-S-isoprenylcysteine O-methyltransferase Ste14
MTGDTRTPGVPEPAGAEAAARADRNVRRFWISTVVLTPVLGVMLFWIAGTVAWPGAWIFLAIFWIAAIVGGLVIPRDLAAERGGIPDGIATYDKVIAPLLARILPLATFVVAGLDRRHGWSEDVGAATVALGLLVTAAGTALLVWAMASNRFFSGFMRIQTDRGHTVVDTGPYARVRHPGYTGLVLYTIGTPLALGSLWAVIPSAVIVIVVVLRTVLEDRALHERLEGYPAYAERVRSKLVPGVW